MSAAIDRLERLLLILPRAQREEGATFAELEELLEVDRRTLHGDIELLTSRASYLQAGDPADFQLQLEADRVRIFGSKPFARPPKLGSREALALALGLRTRALVRGDAEGTRLMDRLEGALAREATEGLEPLPVEDASARPVDGRIRDRILEAIATRLPIRFRYLKRGAPGPEERRLHPLTLLHAEGRWYLMGERPEGGVRAFRIDRILSVETGEEPFEWPQDFDPREYVEGGRVFLPREAEAVTVDYSPKIARWIEERLEGEALEDGGFRVVHHVADREWLVRHVLAYGGEAVAHPPGREWVVEALRWNREGGRGISEP